MKKSILLFLGLSLAMMVQAQVTKTINLSTAGTLATLLTVEEKSTVTKLIITGTIDASDFKTMKDDMPVLDSIDLSGTTIAAYSGTAGTYQYSTVYAANAIPQYAFCNSNTYQGKTSLASFIYPASVTSIGNYAFLRCSGLKGSLTIPASVTSIGDQSFLGCDGLTGLTIPASVTSIGQHAFEGCSGFNGSLTIPTSVISIGESAFFSCWKLTGSLTIPASVTSIG